MRHPQHLDASVQIMRTTVTLASDVAAAVEQLQRERGLGISDAINELVRRGLAVAVPAKPFRQQASAMGEAALPLDDIAGLLEALDGPAAR
jgi:hypothetical protein